MTFVMKRSALTLSLFATTAFLLATQPAFAEVRVNISGNEGSSNVSVNQEGSGESTTCVNGECTTKSGSNKSTVCINGDCTTSDNGNIDVQSQDGSSKVTVSNDAPPATEEPEKTEEKVAPTEKAPDAEAKKEVQEKKQMVEKEIESLTEKIKKELESLQNFLKGLFS